MEGYSLQKSKSGKELGLVDVNAPVYPVETKHNFPPETPKREEAPGHDDLKTPVRGVDGKHSFKDKAPVALEDKHLTGPVLDVERSHG